jgi:hypothetical protein
MAEVTSEEIDAKMAGPDRSHFGDGQADSEKLWTLLRKDEQLFIATTTVAKGPDFDIKLKPGTDLSFLNSPPFRKSGVEKKAEGAEVTKMLESGILEKSTFHLQQTMSSCRRRFYRTARVLVHE